MKGIRYILTLLTLCVAVISCERDEVNRYPIEGTGKMIKFSVESEWPEITRSVVNTSDNIKESGFKVWSNLALEADADDKHPVFGVNGATVSYQNGLWKCVKEQAWYKGHYDFAAALPPSLFQGTYSESTLNLQTGTSGYDLASRQDDLMYAFSNIDNSDGDASVVNLTFNHAFALLDIRIATESKAPFASEAVSDMKIMVYGIHRKMSGKLNISHSTDGVISTNIAEILTEKTTEGNPYCYRPYTGGQGYNLSLNMISFFPSKLLVFPENLAESPLTITIVVKRGSEEVTISRTINEGVWSPGSTNVYIFEI